MSAPYCPQDMTLCADRYGAACGHGALAAVLAVPVAIVCHQLFADSLPKQRWINMPTMEEALTKAGKTFRIVGRQWPKRGLAMIQFTGPWTRPGVPVRVACQYRHWVAVEAGLVWDANLEDWISREDWGRWVVELLPAKSDGWTIARGYEI